MSYDPKDDPVFHWYCITLHKMDNKGQTQGSFYIGYAENRVSLKDLNEVKRDNNMEDSVVLGVSYLGHMTKEQFTDGV